MAVFREWKGLNSTEQINCALCGRIMFIFEYSIQLIIKIIKTNFILCSYGFQKKMKSAITNSFFAIFEKRKKINFLVSKKNF